MAGMDSTSPHHILMVPLPFQGHVMPFMELANRLVNAGFQVTFVNTEPNHHRLHAATAAGDQDFSSAKDDYLQLVAVPDWLGPDDDRNDLGLLFQAMPPTMSPGLEEIMLEAAGGGRPVTWMLADQNMAWAFPLAKRFGLRTAVFWPASAMMLAIMLNIPKMIETGLIGEDGLPKKDETFELAPGTPALHTKQLGWNCAVDSTTKAIVFQAVLNNNRATADHAEFIILNTFMDLEPQALSFLPSPASIGPLIAAGDRPSGHLWPLADSSTLLRWLDSHPPCSVLYVAFGSHTVFDRAQLQELAHGLELTGRPFLWVVRPDLVKGGKDEDLPPGFLERVEGRALLVGWAPQQMVLAHPSIGCFVSHCGWNSTLEGVRNGVRFLCWPYFTDQFLNQNYICDTWRVGLKMGTDGTDKWQGGKGSELISRERVRDRVEEVMKDKEMRARVLKWKETSSESLGPSGSSYENFQRVLDLMKSTA